jgi:hypothetical protein
VGLYLAEEGDRDPRAEMRASLEAFYDPNFRLEEGEHPQCALPARFRFLDERLDLPRERLPEVACEGLEVWRAGIGARSLTLVFPESFLGSPASSFGHLLLRFDRDPDDDAANLSAYTVDFTADTGGESGPIYLAKGLTGFYPGRVGVHPFDEKARRYGDWENRDIWEYRFALSQAEIDFLLMHVWELRGAEFPYYWLHRNCAYFLLRMLQAVRPELPLWKRFDLYSIPLDVLRAMLPATEPAREARFRPSPLRVLRHALGQLSEAERAQVFALAEGRLLPSAPEFTRLDDTRRARILATAYDLLRYRLLAGEVAEDATRGRAMALLVAVSRTGVRLDLSGEVPVPRDLPETGHGTARVGIAGGVQAGEGFVEFESRPAFHDLVDSQVGHADDAQIDVLAARLRVFGSGRVWLQELQVIEVRSLPPRDRLFSPISWRFETGLATRLHPEKDGDLEPEYVWRSAGGAGLAYQPWSCLRVYGLGEAHLDVGSRLDHSVALGPGGTLGAYIGLPESRFRTHLAGSGSYFALGERTAWWRALVEQSFAVTRSHALRVRASWERIADEDALQVVAGWQVYF